MVEYQQYLTIKPGKLLKVCGGGSQDYLVLKVILLFSFGPRLKLNSVPKTDIFSASKVNGQMSINAKEIYSASELYIWTLFF